MHSQVQECNIQELFINLNQFRSHSIHFNSKQHLVPYHRKTNIQKCMQKIDNQLSKLTKTLFLVLEDRVTTKLFQVATAWNLSLHGYSISPLSSAPPQGWFLFIFSRVIIYPARSSFGFNCLGMQCHTVYWVSIHPHCVYIQRCMQNRPSITSNILIYRQCSL